MTEQPPVISTGELKSLLELTRECFLDLWRTNLPESVLQKAANKTSSHTVASGKYLYLERSLLMCFHSLTGQPVPGSHHLCSKEFLPTI